MDVLAFKVDGLVFYFNGICNVFYSGPIVVYFSSPFRVIIIQTPFYYFQETAFLASVIIVPNFTNVNQL